MRPEKCSVKRRGREAFVGVLVVLATGLWAISERAAASGRADGFCEASIVREVSPPFQGMQALRTPPYGVKGLPFGPPRLEIFPVGLSHISEGSGKIGFYLDARGIDPLRVDRVISTRLSVVDRKGRVRRILRKRVQRVEAVRSVSAIRLSFRVGGKPRLYRVDATFLEPVSGAKVHYADYFRVVERMVDVRLGVNAAEYRGGEVVLMHLENLGTVEVGFGYEFGLEYWSGAAWEASSITLPLWPQVALGLGAGRVQKCQSFPLPSDAPQGNYRLTKRYSTSYGGRFSHVVHAKFKIGA